jgi:hypothetical protein
VISLPSAKKKNKRKKKEKPTKQNEGQQSGAASPGGRCWQQSMLALCSNAPLDRPSILVVGRTAGWAARSHEQQI